MNEAQIKLPPIVTRNSVEKIMSETVFGKKSPNNGKKFYTPLFVAASIANDILWAGADWCADVLNKESRKVFADIYLDENNINEDGTVNWPAWMRDAEDFTAGVITLSKIREAIDELSDQSAAIVTSPDFGATIDGTEDGAKTEAAIASESQLKAINFQIKGLRKQQVDIETKYQARAAKKKATQEAQEQMTMA